MKRIRICDRTLSNGLYTFKPDATNRIANALKRANIGWIELNHALSSVYAVRKSNFDECLEANRKGVNVIFEPLNIMKLSEDDIFTMFARIKLLGLFGFTISDTDGAMCSKDLERLTLYATKHLSEETAIGFRPNGSSAQAFALACDFINLANCMREYYVETSLSGIGKFGGYLPTELLAKYINEHKSEGIHEVSHLLYMIHEYIDPLKNSLEWGV